MKPRRYDAEPPRAGELAAYVDGELTPAEQQRIEDWLADHPESAAEVQSLRRLHDLLRSQAPADPGEASWAATLQRIEQTLAHPSKIESRPPARRRGWLAWALSATAASLVLALSLNFVPRSSQVSPPVVEEPFAVVTADDIEITSIAAADVHALAVGEPPLHPEIVLVSAGDVALRSVESDPQWGFPDMRMNTEGDETPMIYAPLLVADVKKP